MNHAFYKVAAVITAGLLLGACESSHEPTTTHTAPEAKMMSGTFASLDVCMASIKLATTHSLDVAIDKPDMVTGYLSGTKRYFQCEQVESGTKGTYWAGTYDSE